ncbi:hypothetical protein BD779DRAFT_1677290 [Infundibulicybe gibba]|nr:hypothetical protein BD779DRAFT_1677290 [Infundibulicybe gibba]
MPQSSHYKNMPSINNQDALKALAGRVISLCGEDKGALAHLGLGGVPDERRHSEVMRRIREISQVSGFTSLNPIQWLMELADEPLRAPGTPGEDVACLSRDMDRLLIR